MKSMTKMKMTQPIIIFAYVVSSPFPTANLERSGFSALNARHGHMTLALEESSNMFVTIAFLTRYEIKTMVS